MHLFACEYLLWLSPRFCEFISHKASIEIGYLAASAASETTQTSLSTSSLYLSLSVTAKSWNLKVQQYSAGKVTACSVFFVSKIKRDKPLSLFFFFFNYLGVTGSKPIYRGVSHLSNWLEKFSGFPHYKSPTNFLYKVKQPLILFWVHKSPWLFTLVFAFWFSSLGHLIKQVICLFFRPVFSVNNVTSEASRGGHSQPEQWSWRQRRRNPRSPSNWF